MASPTPQDLLAAAETAGQRVTQTQLVHKYAATVRLLRTKGYSDRRIAEWMARQGVPIEEHKVVYNYRKKHNIK